jgi:hypothetical protein
MSLLHYLNPDKNKLTFVILLPAIPSPLSKKRIVIIIIAYYFFGPPTYLSNGVSAACRGPTFFHEKLMVQSSDLRHVGSLCALAYIVVASKATGANLVTSENQRCAQCSPTSPPAPARLGAL